MTLQGFALFETAIGACGVAWSDTGLAALHLPEDSAAATRARLRARFPGTPEAAPPSEIRQAMTAIEALLQGKPADLSSIHLDMDRVPPFHQRVYAAARDIPAGATTTYGELADRIGAPGSARAVGQALGRNPFAIIVPCHRVLGAGRWLGGFSANGGVTTKQRLLKIEGATIGTTKAVPYSSPRLPGMGS
jgi:methylated-DNA-[protein]-cysteine S-methyltransferase